MVVPFALIENAQNAGFSCCAVCVRAAEKFTAESCTHKKQGKIILHGKKRSMHDCLRSIKQNIVRAFFDLECNSIQNLPAFEFERKPFRKQTWILLWPPMFVPFRLHVLSLIHLFRPSFFWELSKSLTSEEVLTNCRIQCVVCITEEGALVCTSGNFGIVCV